ncbi:MAG: hypothetical protein ACYSWP_15865, partial [Planctomycetota bacterium]
ATGSVEGNDYVGGLVGYSYPGTDYSGCFWDIDINLDKDGIGNRTEPNVISKTTSELHMKSTFVDAGWDFLTVWEICDGSNYPKLLWQQPIVADFGCPDGVEGFDFAYFASRWGDEDCGLSDDCDGVDFDFSDAVDWGDFKIFCDHWLEGQ